MAGIEDNMEQMTNYVNQMTGDLQVMTDIFGNNYNFLI